MKDDDELLEQVRDWFKSAKTWSRDWRAEARQNYDFYACHQWTDDDLAAMEEELRQAVTFSRIIPLVDAVVGYQINNRQEVRYLPRQLGDVQVSEVLTGAGAWVEDEADTEDEEEEIFQDLLITGMAWSECRMSYDENIDGQLIPGERFSPLEAYWDGNAKRRNLADAKWRGRGRWMSRDDAEAKWPELKKYDFDADMSLEEDQDDSHDQSRAHEYKNDQGEWYNKNRDEVFILQVQWWDYAPIYRVGEAGKILEFSEERFNKMKEFLDAGGYKYVRQMKKKFFSAFVAGPTILEKGPNAWEDGFTLQCVTGKRDATKGSWFGVVRALIEPQKWSNKFLSDLQDMIVSNRQGGAFVEEDALVNPRQAEEDWNSANPLIKVRSGALGRGAIMERTPPQLPPALDRMIEWCVSAIPAVSGINQEFMGYAERDQPNVLEVQRKRAAMNVLASMFSSLRKYRKDLARAMLALMREYMNDGRLIRIVGGDGMEKYIPLAMDKGTEDYDIVIDESSSSPNQKQETFQVMMALIPHLVAGGVAPPLETLDYMPLPSSLVSKWKEALQPKEQTPEEQKSAQIIQMAAVTGVKEKETESLLNQARARKEMAEAVAQEIQNEAVRMGLMNIEDLA